MIYMASISSSIEELFICLFGDNVGSHYVESLAEEFLGPPALDSSAYFELFRFLFALFMCLLLIFILGF